MKVLLRRLAWRLAPNAMADLADIGDVRARYGSLVNAIERAEERLEHLRAAQEQLRHDLDIQQRDLDIQQRDLDELRVDGRHTAELYDLVFERVRDR